MDKRDYLRSQGFAVGSRGRFSAEMQASLASAPAGTITDTTPRPAVLIVNGSPKPAKTVKVKSGANPKAVRAWAKDNGYEVGDRGRIRPEVFAAYETAKTDAGEKVEQRKPDQEYGATAPMLVDSETKWGWHDEKGKLWTVGVRTACANTGVSLGWCPETEHRAVVGGRTLGLVPVSRV